MQEVKGSVLKARLAFVEEHAGADGLARVLASLSEGDRKSLQSVSGVGWFPFALGKRLDDAIVTSIGGGRLEFFERLGEASAETNLRGPHKAYLTPGRPHAFLGFTPKIYDSYYRTGRRVYEKTGETSAVLTTHDAETFSAPDCHTVIGWYRKALEMCGCGNVSVTEEECRARGGAVCRYRLSWNP
ncbi:MAG: TIGR02265 family protein [Gemmatimonadota bacterium]|nr:TIGR02265 family protein [Gemmatimonadota bacterium]MDH5198629.1 TIGR02265 family protein [Gemmatimonadota bacterium]